MKTCPDCRGLRVPCATCNGRRIVEGEPRDGAEAARVRIAEDVQKHGLRAVYERLKRSNP